MSQINLKLLPIQKGRNINFEKGLKNMRFVYNYKKKQFTPSTLKKCKFKECESEIEIDCYSFSLII